MDIKYLANACEDYIIEQRRWFHRHPEVAWEEVQTTIAIEDQLRKIGLEPVRFEDISGAVLAARPCYFEQILTA